MERSAIIMRCYYIVWCYIICYYRHILRGSMGSSPNLNLSIFTQINSLKSPLKLSLSRKFSNILMEKKKQINPLKFVWISSKIWRRSLKLVSAIFDQIFIFNQMIALQKLWKMFFISSKKLFSFLRYSCFCISVFPSFSPCQPLR